MQGEFTKEEAIETRKSLDEIFKTFKGQKLGQFLGHFNDIFLFISAAEKVAPTEKEAKKKKGKV